jgi:hypothetical protein
MLLIPEAMAFKTAEAGLLTYSFFQLAFPSLWRQRQWLRFAKKIMKITASGNVRGLHPVPFSSFLPTAG